MKNLHFQYQIFKKKIGIVSLFCAFIFIGVSIVQMQLVYAVSDSFTVQTLVGEDTNPPSVPGGFVVTPIASTQINLSWSASTDDFIFSGYHVWRDGVQIATTTQLSYQDTGLSASTTYSYYVTAYDSFFNESASSTLISTTTLAEVVTPSVSEDESSAVYGSMSVLKENVLSMEIFPNTHSALIRFSTDEFVKAVVRWGKTSSYELGSLVENAYTKIHETTISGLDADTKYYVRIEGESRTGVYGVIYTGTFITLEPEDMFPPENVRNLDADEKGEGIYLSWTNPEDEDFERVRVVRSEKFYPSDIADGLVVYEGSRESVLDTYDTEGADILYYTVFSYDARGNISSGSVLRFVRSLGDDELITLDPAENDIGLKYEDIFLVQDGERIPWDAENIRIDGTKQFTISIPYESLPEHLKTIYVIMKKVEGGVVKTFSFLLRINAERTAYTSTVAPLGVLGNFPIQISVFDFKTMQVGYIEGVIESRIVSEYEDFVQDRDYGFIGSIFNDIPPIGWVIGAILIFLFVRFRYIFV